MSALGIVHGLYVGGAVHVGLSDPATSNRRHGAIWTIAKAFGSAVANEARRRNLPISSLSVWSAPLLLGLVSEAKCYFLFCNWAGSPMVRTQELPGAEPPSVDALLSGAQVDFADPLFAFSVPLRSLDASDPVSSSDVPTLTSDFFDFHLGVKTRGSDTSADYTISLVTGGRRLASEPGTQDWQVRIQASKNAASLLPRLFQSSQLAIGKIGDALYLKSSDLDRYEEPEGALNHANQLLQLAAGLVHLWVGSPGDLSAVGAERALQDGTIECLDASAKLTVPVWSSDGKRALAQPVSGAGSLAESLFCLAIRNSTARALLRLVAGTDRSWADLYTILETISKESGGNNAIVERGWAEHSELTRFARTANSTELGRHAQKFDPPSNPMKLSDARTLIFRVARGWFVHSLANPPSSDA